MRWLGLVTLLAVTDSLGGEIPPGQILTQQVKTGQGHEVLPSSPRGALEVGMAGDLYRTYADTIRALKEGKPREALPLSRKARALAFQQYQNGPAPRVLAYRHLCRALYLEEQLSDSIDIDRRLERDKDKLSMDDRVRLLHMRALLLHNQFLAVRSFTGLAEDRLMLRAAMAYESVLTRSNQLRLVSQLGYAALLAERGDRRAARQAFARVSDEEKEAERADLGVAYYFLSMGDIAQAMSRLEMAARRESWHHLGADAEGRSLRALVYRMNDFDRLREHPRFQELVTIPEERARF